MHFERCWHLEPMPPSAPPAAARRWRSPKAPTTRGRTGLSAGPGEGGAVVWSGTRVGRLLLGHSPSPTSDRALQALMRGEEPQLLWAASPDLKPKRSSQFSFGGGHDEDQDRSTTSKSPGKSGTDRSSRPRALTASNSRSPSSRSPRSAVSPRSMGRSASPYSNRAIYVADTPWSHPPQSVPTKAWR
eukprot:g27343.t1